MVPNLYSDAQQLDKHILPVESIHLHTDMFKISTSGLSASLGTISIFYLCGKCFWKVSVSSLVFSLEHTGQPCIFLYQRGDFLSLTIRIRVCWYLIKP